MTTLSLAMIVRDEEANLRRCLESVRGVFDQLVIVDTGSVDGTVAVAQSFGAELHHFEWCDDFAAARNYSFARCGCDYIMWLDADDEVLPDDRSKLLGLKPLLGSADAYLMPYNYAQDGLGQCVCTLFRHRIVRCGVRWRWPIHECLDLPPGWLQQTVDVVITHRRSGHDLARDSGRNLPILSKAVAANPTEPRILFYYAKELFSENRNEECLAAFSAFYANGGGWHDDRINGYLMMALARWKLGREEEAVDSCLEGIKQDPRWAEFYVTIGQIHYDHGRWAQAIPWFQLASSLPVPDVLGTILLDNYTWVPHDRLCKCYSEVGRLRDAYTANERALLTRGADPRLLFNREFLCDRLFPGRVAPRPIRLSVGSGGKHTPSYLCTDLYAAPEVQELFDQTAIPYRTGSVHALHSEHALEHAPGHAAAEQSVAEFARVLRHGGQLWLRVPDLDSCCLQFLKAEDRPRAPGERWTDKEWYRYTIYGFQQTQSGAVDPGQYHYTGFTRPALQRLLQAHGFEVQSVASYDGWGTPSLELQATQVRQPLKVAWMIAGVADYDHGSLRIRRLNVHQWLVDHGVDSQIIDFTDPEAATRAYAADVCVFSSFGPVEAELLDQLQRRGVKCVMDHCEDLHELPYQTDCFAAVDLITCCSTVLANRSGRYGRVTMIPDACEEL